MKNTTTLLSPCSSLPSVDLGPLNEPPLLSSIIQQRKGPGFSISSLSLSRPPRSLALSPKMRRTSSAGVKLCIKRLNALRHRFNIFAPSINVGRGPSPRAPPVLSSRRDCGSRAGAASRTRRRETNKITFLFFSQHEDALKVCKALKFSRLCGGSCNPPPPHLPCHNFLDFVLQRIYIVMTPCCVCV